MALEAEREGKSLFTHPSGRSIQALAFNRGLHGSFSTSSRVSRKYRLVVWPALWCSLWARHQSQRTRSHYSLLAHCSRKPSHGRNTHVRRSGAALVIRSCGSSQMVHCNHTHCLGLRLLSLLAACGNSRSSWSLFAWPACRETHLFGQHTGLYCFARGLARSRLCWVRVAVNPMLQRANSFKADGSAAAQLKRWSASMEGKAHERIT